MGGIPRTLIVPGKVAAFRNRGFDDGKAGRDRLTEFPDAKCKAVYNEGYRRGSERRAAA